MSSSSNSLPQYDVSEIGELRTRFLPYLNEGNVDFLRLAQEICDAMLSTRVECLVILELFKSDKARLLEFLLSAEQASMLKPATVPSLLFRLGFIDQEAFLERNVVNVLAA